MRTIRCFSFSGGRGIVRSSIYSKEPHSLPPRHVFNALPPMVLLPHRKPLQLNTETRIASSTLILYRVDEGPVSYGAYKKYSLG